MDVISSNAPYIINVATRDTNANALGNYKVYIGTTISDDYLIYSGKLYSEEGHAISVPVNLQPIFVNYTPKNIGIMQNKSGNFQPVPASSSLSQRFTVVYDNTSGNTDTKEIYMIYCTENATNHELGWDSNTNPFPYIANDFIQNTYVAGTYFSLLRLCPGGSTSVTLELTETLESGDVATSTMTYTNGTYRSGGVLQLNDSTVSFSISIDGKLVINNMKVVNCLPENSYILYYVNSLGAIDWLICDKKNTVTYNAERHSMTRYANIQDRTAFGKLNYLNNTSTTWALNTDIMTDEQSKQMYKLFNSEYIWLYDVDKGQMNSVVIEDANLKIKKYSTDKVYNYTITVKSSQTFTIQ